MFGFRVHFTIVFTVVTTVVVVNVVFVAVVLICHFAGRLTLVIQSASPSASAFKFHAIPSV